MAEPSGVNLVGFFGAEFGQGEVVRRLDTALRHAGIPHATIPYEDVPHRQEAQWERIESERLHDVNIACLNAEHLLNFVVTTSGELLDERYTAGVWFWETSRFPEYLRPALKFVDEVWVASTFVAGAIAAETAVPVLTFPLPVEAPPPPPLSRADLGLPDDRFLFTFVFDFYSTVERKNPEGLVAAFIRAFAPGDGAYLVVKSINGARFPDQLRRLQERAADRDDIEIVDGFVPADHVRAFTTLADCSVSLHRSEGFGLTLAEAMACGKPTIATGYSGNLTFMNEDNSYLVRYELAELEEDVGPYSAGSIWADPDVDDAARLMRRVLERPEEAAAKAERGRETILRRHSLDRTAEFLAKRVPELERLATERRLVKTPGRYAAEFLARGPRLSWDEPHRLGRPGVWARKAVLRLLRPYVVRQRELEHALVDAVRELELARAQERLRTERLEAVTRLLQERTRRLHRRVTELESQRDGS